jgi:hypothetical protein
MPTATQRLCCEDKAILGVHAVKTVQVGILDRDNFKAQGSLLEKKHQDLAEHFLSQNGRKLC